MCTVDQSKSGVGSWCVVRGAYDRRNAPRVLLNLEVDYLQEDTFLFAYVMDLSTLGIFIRSTTPLPPGTHLNLRFTLPTERRPLEAEGEVIWVNTFRPGDFSSLNPGMGVRFVELERSDRRRIRRLVRTMAYLEGSATEVTLNEEDLAGQYSDLPLSGGVSAE